MIVIKIFVIVAYFTLTFAEIVSWVKWKKDINKFLKTHEEHIKEMIQKEKAL